MYRRAGQMPQRAQATASTGVGQDCPVAGPVVSRQPLLTLLKKYWVVYDMLWILDFFFFCTI